MLPQQNSALRNIASLSYTLLVSEPRHHCGQPAAQVRLPHLCYAQLEGHNKRCLKDSIPILKGVKRRGSGNGSYKNPSEPLLGYNSSFTASRSYSSLISVACIQIVEGNPHLRSLLGWHLQQSGFRVYQSADIVRAREVFQTHRPNVVVLDAQMPEGNGLEFCRWLYQQGQTYILMLSARSTEADIVSGLKAGADDYLTKPFGMQEFLARVEALTRRMSRTTAPVSLTYGALNIDLVQRRVRYRDTFIDLTPQEFSLLYVLTQAGGAPLSRTDLLQRAWPDAIDNPRTVDTHILSLRKKIERDPRQPSIIQTVRNVGYRFNVDRLVTDSTPRSPVENNGTHARMAAEVLRGVSP